MVGLLGKASAWLMVLTWLDLVKEICLVEKWLGVLLVAQLLDSYSG